MLFFISGVVITMTVFSYDISCYKLYKQQILVADWIMADLQSANSVICPGLTTLLAWSLDLDVAKLQV